jgi:LmbE family N-acetylglucosaminyl deacetylase
MWMLICLWMTVVEPDRGLNGLLESLRRLQTSARVLYVTAHPDDEDAATLTALARGYGAKVMLLSLTRGEGGANVVSAHAFDELGALRTLEMLEAARYYGVEVRFTSAADYGYSKSVEEAWRKWNRDQLVDEVVAVIRQFKPHVILSRWQGTAADGHGQHTAAGIVARLAFDAVAGDIERPMKLYTRVRREQDAWTVRIEAGDYNPVLGLSYAQLAREGYLKHRSQAVAPPPVRPGSHAAFYRLTRHHLPVAPATEQSIFDHLEAKVAPPGELRQLASRALASVSITAPETIAPLLVQGVALARQMSLAEEAARWESALHRALGAELEVNPATRLVTPNQETAVALAFYLRGGAITRLSGAVIPTLKGTGIQGGLLGGVAPAGTANQPVFELDALAGWQVTPLSPGLYRVVATPEAEPTAAHWWRDSITAPSYQIEDARQRSRPLPRPPLVARVTYDVDGVSVTLERPVPLTLAPPLSIRFTSQAVALPASRRQLTVKVNARAYAPSSTEATLKLELPPGWLAKPPSHTLRFSRAGEEQEVNFELTAPPQFQTATLTAVATTGGAQYRSTFLPVTTPDSAPLYLRHAARLTVRRVDVEPPRGRRVGYLMGTGDSVPDAIRQLDVPCDFIQPGADFSPYSTIVFGIRAYAAHPELARHNQRFLDWVARGGTLIVQYNTPEFDHNFGPYPYSMGANPEEVADEDAPVTVLAPKHPLLTTPNRIGAADFQGWFEQRGSKFLTSWDQRYEALVETHDEGQAPQRGALLVARHGKGYYVYCALALYRQLPLAHPGAVRLLANLLALAPPAP